MLIRWITPLVACVLSIVSVAADEPAASGAAVSGDVGQNVRSAIERAIPLIEAASSGSASERQCFTCHSQAMPVLALSAARQLGLGVSDENLKRQVEHTVAFLKRGKENYDNGTGQGGGVDTAGYALWTLSAAERPSDETTASVTAWVLQKQRSVGRWNCSSNRPPSEKSHFTTTYVALRALGSYGTEEQQVSISEKRASALKWLTDAETKDTEDVVFRLLALAHLDADEELIQSLTNQLLGAQHEGGGWSQTEDLPPDAYATATVLYALFTSGNVQPDHAVYEQGVRFLLEQQLDDGSWHIKSRSKPFQEYFETGFPHDEDQFISTTATCWAVMALLPAMHDAPASPQPVPRPSGREH